MSYSSRHKDPAPNQELLFRAQFIFCLSLALGSWLELLAACSLLCDAWWCRPLSTTPLASLFPGLSFSPAVLTKLWLSPGFLQPSSTCGVSVGSETSLPRACRARQGPLCPPWASHANPVLFPDKAKFSSALCRQPDTFFFPFS